jgi:hypothetical protein
MSDQGNWARIGVALAAGIGVVALITYWDRLPAPVQDMVARALPEPNPIFGAVWSWVRGALPPTPGEKPARVGLCINAGVPSYGNMREREDKALQWLRAHKEEFGRAVDEGNERWEGKFKSLLDLDDPKFLEGFRLTFSVGHTAGCLEHEKQLARQAASATDQALFDSCINANLGMQMGEAIKELPDFELKQHQNRDNPDFGAGLWTGSQRGHVSGCMLADALKRSGY